MATMEISAKDVFKLRKQTGAGMMDCKKALVESNGDFEKAIIVLRKKGQKVAAKRADRDTTEGIATIKINSKNTVGVAIVLACETDFVAKNDSFKELADSFADIAINCENKEEFLQLPIFTSCADRITGNINSNIFFIFTKQ